MEVRIFYRYSFNDLESDINDFIAGILLEVVDIKFSMTYDNIVKDTVFSAMIIYKT